MRTLRNKSIRVVGILLILTGCKGQDEHPVVGTLERDRIALSAELAEPVAAIEVDEGDRVAAGQPLLQLDARRAEAELSRLQARADRAARRLDELLRGPRQEAIDEARARLAAAESGLRTAEQDLERVRRLSDRDLASRRDLDTAENARERAESEYDAARAALAALVEGTTAEELDQARAAVREAEAAVAGQRLTIERLTLASPRAARVEALPFELGETPRVGDALVVLRAADQAPYARVYVPAELKALFRTGAQVRVHVEHLEPRRGRVRYIASEAAFTPYFALTEHDAGRLSYLAEIDLENGEDLPVGVPVRAVVLEGGDE